MKQKTRLSAVNDMKFFGVTIKRFISEIITRASTRVGKLVFGIVFMVLLTIICTFLVCHRNHLLDISETKLRALIDDFQKTQSVLTIQASTWECASFYLGQMKQYPVGQQKIIGDACIALSVALADFANRTGVHVSAKDFQQPAVWGRYQLKNGAPYVPDLTI